MTRASKYYKISITSLSGIVILFKFDRPGIGHSIELAEVRSQQKEIEYNGEEMQTEAKVD
jgi:hypothetical protein